MKVNLKSKRGITLVALIITIIVLLILAMVSIRLVMNGGIIDKSKNAVDKYSQEEIQEQLKLAYSEWQMSQYTGTPMTAQDIQTKLGQIFGAENVTDVSLVNGKLTAKINGTTYEYDIATGKSGEYIAPISYGTKTKETIEPGDDITIGGTEKFKVFSVTNGEIKAMPYYNLKLDSNPMRQATEEEKEKEGRSVYSSNNQYITAYNNTLNNYVEDLIETRLANKSELSEIISTMRNPGQTGAFFTSTPYTGPSDAFWCVDSNGELYMRIWFLQFNGSSNYNN